MLIVKKFHDYYDTALGVGGVDKAVVYNRESQTVEKGRRGFETTNPADIYDHNCTTQIRPGVEISVKSRCIGFCGQLYPVILIKYTLSKDFIPYKETLHAFYDADSL